MELIVLGDECPVCRSGPLGYIKCESGVYVRCVECSSYWRIGGKILFDNPVDLSDGNKSNMRPASLEEIKCVDSGADLAGRWSHAGGFTSL
jgi:hypothetical protein